MSYSIVIRGYPCCFVAFFDNLMMKNIKQMVLACWIDAIGASACLMVASRGF